MKDKSRLLLAFTYQQIAIARNNITDEQVKLDLTSLLEVLREMANIRDNDIDTEQFKKMISEWPKQKGNPHIWSELKDYIDEADLE